MKYIIALLASLIVLTAIGCETKVEPAKIYRPKYKSTQKIPVDFKKATVSGKPIVIFFYAKWDTTSNQVKPFINALKDKFDGSVNFFLVNVDDPKMAYMIAKFNVGYLPDTVILDTQSKTLMRVDGWIDSKTIQASIQKALDQ